MFCEKKICYVMKFFKLIMENLNNRKFKLKKLAN
jgi:hypothetical protein